jgi:hypothetical protein
MQDLTPFAPVLIDHVRAALHEMSDLEYQSRVWTGRGGRDEMSSFVECVERLYDDSGLELALDADEPVFGTAIDDQLRELGNLVGKIDADQSPEELIASPRMRMARERAGAILSAIDKGASDAAE